jgi:hypothetical protein
MAVLELGADEELAGDLCELIFEAPSALVAPPGARERDAWERLDLEYVPRKGTILVPMLCRKILPSRA